METGNSNDLNSLEQLKNQSSENTSIQDESGTESVDADANSINPTIGGTLLGAYVLGTRKIAKLFTKSEKPLSDESAFSSEIETDSGLADKRRPAREENLLIKKTKRNETVPMDPKMKAEIRAALEETKRIVFSNVDVDQPAIIICAWKGRAASEALILYPAMEKAIEKNKADARIEIIKIDGDKLSGLESLVMVLPAKVIYVQVQENDAEEIVERTLKNGEILDRLLYDKSVSEPARLLTIDDLAALAAEDSYLPAVESEPADEATVINSASSHLPTAKETASSSFQPSEAHSFISEEEFPDKTESNPDAEMVETEIVDLLPLLNPRTLKLIHPKKIDLLKLQNLSQLEEGTAESLKAEYAAYETFLQERDRIRSGGFTANTDEAEFLTVSELFTKTDETKSANQQMAALNQLKAELASEYKDLFPCITVCAGDGCCALGALELFTAFNQILDEVDSDIRVELKKTGCRGFCGQGPLVMLMPANILYVKVKPEDAERIIDETLKNGNVISSLLYKNPESGKCIPLEKEIPFYKLQTRVLTKDSAKIDPESLGDYIKTGGYEAIAKALTMKPEQVIEQIKESKLRGRGGAGFPTWKKWDICRSARSDVKYLIVNCDSGDPGSFDDPALMAANPHLILEGLLIGAYAVRASKGYVYVRSQYAGAVKMMEKAVQDAYLHGLLGEKIFTSDFNFDVVVQLAASAYITGEETNVINSIEGNPGEPRQRPPFPTTSGLWGKPTIVSNVKTWASIPSIILNTGAWYAQMGSKKSGGTTLISLVGFVNNTGFAEVQLGTPLRTIIEKIGGGTPRGKLKAVQTGGPTGAFIPEKNWEISYDYESLKKAGSDFGPVLSVYPENTCIIQQTLRSLQFIRNEACGRCLSCRVGIPQMIKLLEYIVDDRAERQDLITLKDLSISIRDGSMCNLGRNASMVVLASMTDYPEEYEDHMNGKCPGGGCPKMVTYTIDHDQCTGCGSCQQVCPVSAIKELRDGKRTIDESICIRCGYCYNSCADNAVSYQ